MEVDPYRIINGYPYKLEPYDVLRICFLKHERDNIIGEEHASPTRGHFHSNTTSMKILQVGL
jgi:hypothetical protein